MDNLQHIFEKEIMGQFTFPIVGAKLIKRQLEKKGVFLNENQVCKLEKKLKDFSGDTLSIDFELSDDKKKILEFSDDEKVEIDLDDSDQELEEIYQNLITNLKDTIPQIIIVRRLL